MFGKPSKKLIKQLQESGTRANATIVEIAEKGMAVTRGADNVVGNTEIALKTHLKVQPENEPEFEVTKRFSYPQLAVPGAGQTIPVLYDPSDHDKIIVDPDPAAQQNAAFTAAGIDPNQISQLMEQAQQAQQAAGSGQSQVFSVGGAGAAQADPVAQLERLTALKEKGALTDAEFEAEKQKIIGS